LDRLSDLGENSKMNRTAKQKATALMTAMENGMNMAAMTERLGLSTVPAAWPTGVSQLAQAIDVLPALRHCRRVYRLAQACAQGDRAVASILSERFHLHRLPS
jgi:hypothetical protein